MQQVIDGTSSRAKIPGINVCGKTGTAENSASSRAGVSNSMTTRCLYAFAPRRSQDRAGSDRREQWFRYYLGRPISRLNDGKVPERQFARRKAERSGQDRSFEPVAILHTLPAVHRRLCPRRQLAATRIGIVRRCANSCANARSHLSPVQEKKPQTFAWHGSSRNTRPKIVHKNNLA